MNKKIMANKKDKMVVFGTSSPRIHANDNNRKSFKLKYFNNIDMIPGDRFWLSDEFFYFGEMIDISKLNNIEFLRC